MWLKRTLEYAVHIIVLQGQRPAKISGSSKHQNIRCSVVESFFQRIVSSAVVVTVLWYS